MQSFSREMVIWKSYGNYFAKSVGTLLDFDCGYQAGVKVIA